MSVQKTNSTVAVSVIVPVYNVAEYLPRCLDTICKQTLQNIEIICIDDGSTDSSFKILQEYAEKDRRIRLVQQKNAGAGAARNTGLKIAQGKYLSILDADDFFELDMLEKAYLKSEGDGADVCVFRANQYDQQRKIYQAIPWTIKKRYVPKNIPFHGEDIYQYTFQIFNGWAWDKLYRRDFIEKNALQFQELRTTNDAYFVFLANIFADRITFIDEIFAHHRINVKVSLSATREKSWECCWYAIYAIKTELERKKYYKRVEQSFVNWSIHFLLWNIYTLQGDAKENLLEAIKQNYATALQIEQYSSEYFYDVIEYRNFLKICHLGKTAEIKEPVLHKMVRNIKENGTKATLDKITGK